jgi:hypothetical protein
MQPEIVHPDRSGMMKNEKMVIRTDVHRVVRERIAAVKDQRVGFGIVNRPPAIA